MEYGQLTEELLKYSQRVNPDRSLIYLLSTMDMVHHFWMKTCKT